MTHGDVVEVLGYNTYFTVALEPDYKETVQYSHDLDNKKVTHIYRDSFSGNRLIIGVER